MYHRDEWQEKSQEYVSSADDEDDDIVDIGSMALGNSFSLKLSDWLVG